MNTNQIGSMCKKNEVNCSFIKLFTSFFTTGYNVTKLAMLSTVKHLKYDMKHIDFRRES